MFVAALYCLPRQQEQQGFTFVKHSIQKANLCFWRWFATLFCWYYLKLNMCIFYITPNRCAMHISVHISALLVSFPALFVKTATSLLSLDTRLTANYTEMKTENKVIMGWLLWQPERMHYNFKWAEFYHYESNLSAICQVFENERFSQTQMFLSLAQLSPTM